MSADILAARGFLPVRVPVGTTVDKKQILLKG
jgi:hypothetical protein